MKLINRLLILLIVISFAGCYTQIAVKDDGGRKQNDEYYYEDDTYYEDDYYYEENPNDSEYYSDGRGNATINNYYGFNPRRYYWGYHPGVSTGISIGIGIGYYDPYNPFYDWYYHSYGYPYYTSFYSWNDYYYYNPYRNWGYYDYGYYGSYSQDNHKYRKNHNTALRDGSGRGRGRNSRDPLDDLRRTTAGGDLLRGTTAKRSVSNESKKVDKYNLRDKDEVPGKDRINEVQKRKIDLSNDNKSGSKYHEKIRKFNRELKGRKNNEAKRYKPIPRKDNDTRIPRDALKKKDEIKRNKVDRQKRGNDAVSRSYQKYLERQRERYKNQNEVNRSKSKRYYRPESRNSNDRPDYKRKRAPVRRYYNNDNDDNKSRRYYRPKSNNSRSRSYHRSPSRNSSSRSYSPSRGNSSSSKGRSSGSRSSKGRSRR